jgi:hypothetical protein
MIDKGYNIYSQFGEDGILQFLIECLGLTNKQCCEFGMFQTVCSNTFNLVENYGWDAVYIEYNKERYNELTQKIKGYNVEAINKKVEIQGDNCLDNILKNTILTSDFDVLSIDVDNIDYHIWKSLKNYQPKVVIIEINPFYKVDEDYIYDGTNFSSSFKSTLLLGLEKGYTLVCMSGNLIFVRTDLVINNKDLKKYTTIDPNSLFLDDAVMISDITINFKRYIKKHII